MFDDLVAELGIEGRHTKEAHRLILSIPPHVLVIVRTVPLSRR